MNIEIFALNDISKPTIKNIIILTKYIKLKDSNIAKIIFRHNNLLNINSILRNVILNYFFKKCLELI